MIPSLPLKSTLISIQTPKIEVKEEVEEDADTAPVCEEAPTDLYDNLSDIYGIDNVRLCANTQIVYSDSIDEATVNAFEYAVELWSDYLDVDGPQLPELTNKLGRKFAHRFYILPWPPNWTPLLAVPYVGLTRFHVSADGCVNGIIYVSYAFAQDGMRFIATHELGHVLGLLDSLNPADIMYHFELNGAYPKYPTAGEVARIKLLHIQRR